MDEPFTIFHAQESALDILKLPAHNEPNPPLFMLILHFWIKLFGISAPAVRILPLFFNSLSVVFIYLASKKVFSNQVALLASSIFLLASLHFYFGLETRAYSLLSCAAVASYYYFNLFVNHPNKLKFLAFLFIANLFLIYSHYFGWFVVFAQFIGSLFYLKNKNILFKLWSTIGLTFVAFIPMAIVFVSQFFKSSQGTWVKPPQAIDFIGMLHTFLNSSSRVFALLLLIGFISYFIFDKTKIDNKKSYLMLFTWWFVPYTLMFILSFKIPMFINRYVLFNSIPFYIFLSAIFVRLFFKPKYALQIISGIILVILFIPLKNNSKKYFYREVKNSVDKVKQQQTKNSIILIHPQWTSLGFMYYYNPDIFKQPKLYDSLLKVNNIYPLWSQEDVNKISFTNPSKTIIYYQNGSLSTDPNNSIYKALNASLIYIDSTFFPQCLYVSTFKSKSNFVQISSN